MSSKKQSRGLGRGLSALMADVAPEAPQANPDQPRKPDQIIPIEKIAPNPEQPRRRFAPEDLEDLAASIREKGVIQPLIVRENKDKAGTYEIVAGERRWRAAQMAKLHEVPALIREYTDTEALEVAIIENIQRADLNAVEEAAGYRDLMDRFGHTQEKLAEALGKSRPHIANMLRLLNLPDEVLGFLREGKLTAGHARALITAKEPVALARKAVADGLSVREIERAAKAPTGETGSSSGKSSKSTTKDADTVALENDLSAALGMKVTIDHKPGQEAGALTVRYDSLNALDDLCRKLGG